MTDPAAPKPLQALWPHEISDDELAKKVKESRRPIPRDIGCIVCGAHSAGQVRCTDCDARARARAKRAVKRAGTGVS